MATETKTETIVDRLVAAIMAGIAKLADSQPTLNFPTDTESESLIRSLFTTGSKPHMRARAKPTATPAESVLFTIVAWHRSPGNLHSIMNAQWKVNRDTFDRLESLSTVLVLVAFGRSVACANWDRALGRS